MAEVDYKQIIQKEYVKCAQDPIYFFRKYMYISHPTKGRVKFDLYRFQELTFNELVDNDYNIVLKARQMGISTLVAGYALWLMLFQKSKNVLVIATKQDVAKNLVSKVRYAHENLPKWLQNTTTEDNKLSLRFGNGSEIKAISSSPEAGRSESLSLLILDEAAFIEHIEEIWGSAQQTLATGGKCIALSCVVGDTFVFTDKGIQQVKDFIPSNNIGDYCIGEYNVLGNNKLRKGNLFHTNGHVPTKIIKTKFSELEGSHNHKLWACVNGKYNWYRLDELSADDWVNIQYGMNIWGNNDDTSDFNPTINGNHTNIFKSHEITNDIAYLMGLYLSEGSSYKILNENGDLVGGSITITCGDDVSEYINRCGLRYNKYDELHYGISSKTLIEFFEHVGFDFSLTASEKYIPNRLMQLSKEKISHLLRGIFDGDGFSRSDNGCVGIGLSSERLINQIRIILNNFGILSSKYKVTKEYMNEHNSFDNKFNYDSHRLELNYRNSMKFYDEISFNFDRKQQNRHLIEDKKFNNNSDDVIPYSLDMVNHMFDVYGKGNWTWKKYHNISLSRIVNKKTKYKTQHISSDTVSDMYRVVYDKLDDDIRNEYDKIIIPNSTWVQIKDIVDSENETFDFSLPDDDSDFWSHSVIYNGILGHQTPNGMGNWFHQMWVGSKEGQNNFNPINLHWSLHPDRDQNWRDEQDKVLGTKMASQELDCDFISSGHTVIDSQILKWYQDTLVKEPVEKRGRDGNLWIWEYCDYSKDYVITADVARGDGKDYSAFHIMEVESMKQVGSYKGKIDTKEYGRLLNTIGREYNNALVVVENANIGWAVLQEIIDMDYPNIFYSSRDLQVVDVHYSYINKKQSSENPTIPGFTTSSKTRPMLISKLDEYLREKAVEIYDSRLIDELFTFIWFNQRAEAMRGYNDDLVMSYAIALWVRDTALRLRQEGIDLTKESLNHIKRTETVISSNNYGMEDPYKKTVNGEEIDLRWLFD